MTKAELIAAMKDFPDDIEVDFSCSECVFKSWHPIIKLSEDTNFLGEPTYYLSIHLEGSNE